MSSITILGAYGTKSDRCGSSAFLLNDTNVIDAGNLLKPLKEVSAEIETIWLTHSHLDHISDIAFILDNYFEIRTKPLRLCGLKETLETLKTHFFNHQIWPDFSTIPLHGSKEMSLIYEEIVVGEQYILGEGEYIEAFYADHTVATCGYVVSKAGKSLLISSDTYSLDNVIDRVEKNSSIQTLLIECSFPSSMFQLAKESKHLTPELLFDKLAPLKGKGLKLYINHLKPNYEILIKEEIQRGKGNWDITVLEDGDIVVF